MISIKTLTSLFVVLLLFSSIPVQCIDTKKMLDLCNKERAKVGAPALSHN
ncbi:21459_t:CDS:1, partial [Racocetra persica]